MIAEKLASKMHTWIRKCIFVQEFKRKYKRNRDVYHFALCIMQYCCSIWQGVFNLIFLILEWSPGSYTLWYNFKQPDSYLGNLNC